MNQYGKCVCILLLTVFLGGDGGSPMCTVDGINKCVELVKDVKDFETLDLDDACQQHVGALLCMFVETENCTDALLSQYQDFMNELNFTEAVCQSNVYSISRDPSVCPAKKIMSCTVSLEFVLETGQSNPHIVCPKLVTALGCLTKTTASCPEMVRDRFHAFYVGVEQRQRYCVNLLEEAKRGRNNDFEDTNSDGDKGSGEGLNADVWVLLVAAMLVVIRHFL